ncbi:hypothetical protein FHX06_006686 [Rhizobium sp. BK512]|jgi:hypothetical protein|nr:hypothetical protein [Rhizobium sp. BK512]MBB3565316.1 hypothetical protein [Rhizobium sp. BK512]
MAELIPMQVAERLEREWRMVEPKPEDKKPRGQERTNIEDPKRVKTDQFD